ncbi:hypothetical protein [Vibrio sp. 10N.261.46.A3]|uniref:hypothetical protein n=1 Tax=Vibrio sp. 10N.261.46.A3 TaxID=3229658 RepID=UPI00354BE735
MNNTEKSQLRQEFETIKNGHLRQGSKYDEYKNLILTLRHHRVSYEKISQLLPFKSSASGIRNFISISQVKSQLPPKEKAARTLPNNPNQLSLILIKNEVEYLYSLHGCTMRHIKGWLYYYKNVDCSITTIGKALRRWKEKRTNSHQSKKDK